MKIEPHDAWGKTDRAGGWHALAAHSLDVAAVMYRLLLLPVIQARAERAAGRPLEPGDIARIAALVFLHDVGKLHPGFQAKARPDLPRWPGGPVSHASAGLGLVSIGVGRPDHPLHPILARIGEWGPALEEIIPATFAHHGKPVSATMTRTDQWKPVSGYDWRKPANELSETLLTVFPSAFETGPLLPEAPAFVHFIAGLTALADWIGSDQQFFPFEMAPDDGYHERALQQAGKALKGIGLDTASLVPTGIAFDAVSPHPNPNPAQVKIGEANPSHPLVILEAETGSGKTEAALWRFARLFDAGAVSGLYFAVPTRAAARQLHRRVDAALRRLFGPAAPPAILAIPGLRVAGDAVGQRLPGFETRWEDVPGPVPARWAAEHATRYLAATVAVGTVDQALLAALQVKHAHLRGTALARSLLVVDEVHASDVYMTTIVSALLKAHLAVGGHALLMSATLGSTARAAYQRTPPPDLRTALDVPYPAVWTGPDPTPAAGAGQEKSVTLETRGSMAAELLADEAIDAARQGARVLVIRNTVAAAREAFEAVRAAGHDDLLLTVAGAPALHHSRFAPEDRALLDEEVELVLKPDPGRVPKGVIVIGTQTLEQSLDIDADFLISDLCPVDVLLQRLGRLHRHVLPRPSGFELPRAILLTPEGGLDRLTKPAFENGLGGWETAGGLQGIYTDLLGLELTRRLATRTPWRIPAMNRELVEAATHPEAQAALIAEKGAAWADYDRRIVGKRTADRTVASLGLLERHRPFPERFLDFDQLRTRLGEQGPIVPLAPGTLGPFGAVVSSLTLPARWLPGDLPASEPVVTPLDEGFSFAVGERMFTYTRKGIDRVPAGPAG